MARLPTPGGDNGSWGEILNEYLKVTLDDNGNLRTSAITESKIPDTIARTSDVSDLVDDHNTDSSAHSDIRGQIAAINSTPKKTWPVGMYLSGATVEDMVTAFGWAPIQPGIVWDGQLKHVVKTSPTTGTISVLSPSEGDIAIVSAIFDVTTSQQSPGGIATFDSNAQIAVPTSDLGEKWQVWPTDKVFVNATNFTGNLNSLSDASSLTDVLNAIDALNTSSTLDMPGNFFDVKAYGATGDGSTDDTDAFEDACAAAQAAGGGEVFVPSGTFLIRRSIKLPSNTILRGQGESTIIKRHGNAFKSAVTSDVPSAGSTSVTVADTSGFSTGDQILLSDNGNWEWNATRTVITNISGNTITFDKPTESNYIASNEGYVYRVFPMITNADRDYSGGMNDYHENIVVRDLLIDQERDDNMDPVHSPLFTGGPWVADFTVAAIHWEAVYRAVVDNVRIINAVADSYSDQARIDGNLETNNVIRNCHISNSGRHGIHFGSSERGAVSLQNHVEGARGYGLFLCAEARHSIIMGNTFSNCESGISGADARQPDGSNVTPSTPYDDIGGDIGSIIIGNTFIGGPSNNPGSPPNDSSFAISAGPKSVISNNMIMHYNGGIELVQWAVDCIVQGNYINLPSNVSTRSGISVKANANHANINDNTIGTRPVNSKMLC